MKRALPLTLIALGSSALAYQPTAPVSGYVEAFIVNTRLADGTVTILETGETVRTNEDGRFGPIAWPVGKPITLRFDKDGFVSTQSATVTVPVDGLNDKFHEITFQVPSNFMLNTFKQMMGIEFKPGYCHLASTVTAYGKILADTPQGVADAAVQLIPDVGETPFYFGVYDSGPLKDKTNPWKKGLTKTSVDGGIFLFNVPASSEPYELSATKPGVPFSTVRFTCNADQFINLSPPQGPRALVPES